MTEQLHEVQQTLPEPEWPKLKRYTALFLYRGVTDTCWLLSMLRETPEDAEQSALKNAVPGTIRVFEIPEPPGGTEE